MSDKYQLDVTRSLRTAGFSTMKLPDFVPDPKGRGAGKYPVMGRPDLFFAGLEGGGYVEVKTGTNTSFAFNSWREEQRNFWEKEIRPYDAPYFIAAFAGEGHKGLSRLGRKLVCVLIPAQYYLLLEERQATIGRKSLPYEWLETSEFRLDYAKHKTWVIPELHIFWRILKGERPWGR